MIRSFEDMTPRIHPTAFVSEAAYVIGDVELEEGVSIWPGAVVRGDIGKVIIRRNTAIEDGTIVHGAPGGDMTIGSSTMIGHGVVVHARNVGDHCLIGNGATLSEGSDIGDWCVVGAGTLVLPRARILSRSLVLGHPGAVKGEITEAHERRLSTSFNIHVEMAKRYLKAGLGSALPD